MIKNAKYKMTGEAIIDKMIKEGKLQKIVDQVIELNKRLKDKSIGIFEASEIYSESWNYKSNGERRIDGKMFKAYVRLGWIKDVKIYKNKPNTTTIYKRVNPNHLDYEKLEIA